MRVVIVYESLFGSTHQIAQAITAGLRDADPRADITCVRATEALPEQLSADRERGRVDLLVVGGPTHRLGISSDHSRQRWLRPEDFVTGLGRDGTPLEPDADQAGLRDWLQHLPPAVPGACAATFDTRLDRVAAGSAASRIGRQLRRQGYHLVAPPEGFIVAGTEGPLSDGELERARHWAARRLIPQTVT